jgi:RNA polymerase sigma-70 factor, ECF subfamily
MSLRVDRRFAELYEAEFAAVYRACYALCGDRQLAEDAAQEAFARALERWRRLRERPWAAGWVATTALNVVRRSLRRRGAEPRPEPGAGQAGTDGTDDRLDLIRAIRALPARQQEAVVLHYVADLPVSDVAEAMGVETGTVKAHLARAREALARTLGGERVDG